MRYIKGVTIYTDGACSKNPGPGGWGAVLIYQDSIKELSGGVNYTTNNKMELTAVIKALEALKKPSEINIYSDSNYVILGITRWIYGWIRGGWKRQSGTVKNIELWKELYKLSEIHKIQWRWVKGHSGDYLNERADELAGNAIPK